MPASARRRALSAVRLRGWTRRGRERRMPSRPKPPLVQGPGEPVVLFLAAKLESEPFVVATNPRDVAVAVEADEVTPARCGLDDDPLDDALAERTSGEGAPDRELVQVDRVRGPLAPEERIVEQQRERRGRFAVDLDDVQLAASDAVPQLVLGERRRPLVVPLHSDVRGRFV